MPVFFCLLCLIPFCLFLVQKISYEEKANLKVAVYFPKDATDYTIKSAQNLFNHKGFIEFVECKNENEMLKKLEEGFFISAIKYTNDAEKLFTSFESGRPLGKIKFFVKSDSVVTRLLREEFFALIYENISKKILESYINRTDDDILKKAEFMEYVKHRYELYQSDDNIFALADETIENLETTENDNSFISFPVRGMTSIFVFLIGLAASFYFIRDKKNSLFTYIPSSKLNIFRFFYIAVPVFDAGLVMLFSLRFSQNFCGWQKEILIIIPFLIFVSAFCSLICALTNNEAILASFIPVLVIAALTLCPIFIDARISFFLQGILPLYFYLISADSISSWLFIYPVFFFFLSMMPRRNR